MGFEVRTEMSLSCPMLYRQSHIDINAIKSKIISTEISPFFTYANSKNPSRILKMWFDPEKGIRMHLAYQRCVKCNTQMLNREQLYDLKVAKNTYFCQPCHGEALEKFEKKFGNNETFTKLWNDRLYGSHLPQSKL